MQIKLNSIQDVKDFVNAANKSAKEIDMKSERYSVDAKSLLGMFSLDLSCPVDVIVSGEPDMEFTEAIQRFSI